MAYTSPKSVPSKSCKDRYTKDFTLANPFVITTNYGTQKLTLGIKNKSSLLDFVKLSSGLCYEAVYSERLALTKLEVYIYYKANTSFYQPYLVTTIDLVVTRAMAKKNNIKTGGMGPLLSIRQNSKLFQDTLQPQLSKLYDGRFGKVKLAGTPVMYQLHFNFVKEEKPQQKTLGVISSLLPGLSLMSLIVGAGIIIDGIVLTPTFVMLV